MKRFLTLLAAAFLTVSVAIASDAKVEGYLSGAADGKPVTSFTADAPKLFAIIKTDDTEKGDKLRGAWVAEDVGEVAPPNTKIDEATVTGPTDDFSATFSITRPTAGWPLGKYRVEIYLGDKLVKSLKFTITAAK